MDSLWIPKQLPGSESLRKEIEENGYAVGHDPLDGEDGLDGSDRLGVFLLDRRRWGCRFSSNRRYWPFSCWLNSTVKKSPTQISGLSPITNFWSSCFFSMFPILYVACGCCGGLVGVLVYLSCIHSFARIVIMAVFPPLVVYGNYS